MAGGSTFFKRADEKQAQHDLLCINILLVSCCCYKQMNDVTLPPFSRFLCRHSISENPVWELEKTEGLICAQGVLCLWPLAVFCC